MYYMSLDNGKPVFEVDPKIRKGDKFVCTSDVVMDTDETLYRSGVIYQSDNDDCITGDNGDDEHGWEDDPRDEINWRDHFQRYECCGRCDGVNDKCVSDRLGRDYFQSMQDEYSVPITGDTIGKRTFETGAVRDSNKGKSRPDLISPYFTERLGFRLAYGIEQGYGENNWKKGIPTEAFLESLERHLVAYKMGKTDEDHAGAIAFNIMGIIHNEEVG